MAFPIAKSLVSDRYLRLPDTDSIPTYVLVSEETGQALCGLAFYHGQALVLDDTDADPDADAVLRHRQHQSDPLHVRAPDRDPDLRTTVNNPNLGADEAWTVPE